MYYHRESEKQPKNVYLRSATKRQGSHLQPLPHTHSVRPHLTDRLRWPVCKCATRNCINIRFRDKDGTTKTKYGKKTNNNFNLCLLAESLCTTESLFIASAVFPNNIKYKVITAYLRSRESLAVALHLKPSSDHSFAISSRTQMLVDLRRASCSDFDPLL